MRTRLRVLLLLALLVALPLLAAATTASPTPQSTRYYLLSSDDGATYTLFAWHHLERPNATHRFALPLGSAPESVVDQDARALSWAQAADGWIQVGTRNDTKTFTVTARDLPGPATERPVRFPGDRFPDYVVYLGLPHSYVPAEGEPVTNHSVLTTALPTFPLPTGHDYHLVRPDALGATIQVVQRDGSSVTPYALFALLIVLLVGTTLWLMRRVHTSTDDPTRSKEMTILGHLEELRRRIMWVVGVVGIGSVFFFTFGIRFATIYGLTFPYPHPTIYHNAAAQVFAWMSKRVVPPGVEVVVLSPWDAVVTQIGIAVALAVVVAFPVLFYHTYAFLAPALYPKERRAVLFTVPVIVVLFSLGAVFGIGAMLPFMVQVLYGFAGTLQATAFLNVPDLIAMGALMGIVFGLAFELPVVMALLSAIGVVSAATWRRYWRHAAVGIVIVAALVTDPTVITQLVVAGVLFVLYAIGVGAAALLEKKVSEAGPDRAAAPAG